MSDNVHPTTDTPAADADRIEETARAIAARLERNGTTAYHYGGEDDRDATREAAERAGRILDRPVCTSIGEDRVFIWLKDWSPSPPEEELGNVRQRDPAERAFPPPGEQGS
ncbi:hypothetical protein HDA32_001382 [Spinactinospora alkalitolerans]|uniref:Uncharacterized protein n=1 Tax=Spinactinospora alkalitolerans TaxID=687207 RepID=A0A852TTT1_9ACTN|nr:hypothetical protein [Spinactinospora alkalitolerans]NYE46262.1 hypothetical protein [Spinactinospora alkalitolerans]